MLVARVAEIEPHVPHEAALSCGRVPVDAAALGSSFDSVFNLRKDARPYYDAAWDALLRDFCRRIERGDFHLRGTVEGLHGGASEVVIPAYAAGLLAFDFHRGIARRDGTTYLMVIASRGPAAGAAQGVGGLPGGAGAPRPGMPALTPENIRDLTDEEVLLLLEEHARRVIESPDAKLIAPGKISLMPLVAGKLRRRAELGELLPTQAAEMQWLHEWMKSKVGLHQLPKVATIKRVLGKHYEAQKGRSNGENRKG